MHVTFDSLKTFYNILIQKLKNHRGNWNQNDPTADDYIKNRPFYEEKSLKTLVDNLTVSDFDDRIPACNFVPNKKYNVVWNDILYEGLICALDAGYNMLGGDGYPFYIDDNGGDSLYVEALDDSTDWTLSIYEDITIVHQIDPKYIPFPEDATTENDVWNILNDNLASVAWTGNYDSLNNKPSLATVATSGSYNDLNDIPTNLLTYSEQTLTDEQKNQARINIGASDFNGDYNNLNNKPCYIEDVAGEQTLLHDTQSGGAFGFYPCNNDIGTLYYTITLLKKSTWDDIKLSDSDYCNLFVREIRTGNIWKDINLLARNIFDPIVWTKYSNYEFVPVGGVVFGNVSFITGKSEDNTGEPFVICHFPEGYGSPVERNQVVVISNVGFNDGMYARWYVTPHTYVTHKLDAKFIPEEIATKTYVQEEISKIGTDTFEQVQADWNETDETSPAYIKNKPNISADGTLPVPSTAKVGQYLQVSGVDETGIITSMVTVDTAASDWETMQNKPFYDYEGQVDILPLTRYENFTLDSNFGVYGISDSSTYNLTIGETYIVNWDGTDWTCIAQDASSLMSGTIAIGNLTNFGLSGNGEPFVIGVIDGVGVQYFSLTDTEAGGSHEVRIYQEATLSKQIDKRYIPIPFFGKENSIILNCTFDESQGTNPYLYEDSSDSTLIIGDTYNVIWNDITYTCECIEAMGLPAVGNTVALGGEDNGLPFAIARDMTGIITGTIGWMAQAIVPEDDGIYNCIISGNSLIKVDTQYLYQSDWNENDKSSGSYIANRPFSEIPTGTVIVPETSVNLMLQFDEVYYTPISPVGFIENYSYTVEFDGVSYTLTAVQFSPNGLGVMYEDADQIFMIIDNFNGSSNSIVLSTIGEHTFKIALAEDVIIKIDAKYLPDNIGSGSSLPEVTTDDAGKFLRVSSEGTWIVETIQNVAEVGL